MNDYWIVIGEADKFRPICCETQGEAEAVASGAKAARIVRVSVTATAERVDNGGWLWDEQSSDPTLNSVKTN